MAIYSPGSYLTLSAVARSLELPEMALKRLAALFQLPSKYYAAQSNEPRLMLFSEVEAAQLKKAKIWLADGQSVESVRHQLANESADVAFDEYRDYRPIRLPKDNLVSDRLDLMEYDNQTGLNQSLAKETFAQYRIAHRANTSVFKRLAQQLGSVSKRTVENSGKASSRLFSVISRPNPVYQPASSFLSAEFAAKAAALRTRFAGDGS